MKRETGILIVSSIDNGESQMPMGTCCHCNTMLYLSNDPKKSEDGGFCYKCCAILCKQPKCHNNCSPFIARAWNSVSDKLSTRNL